MEMQLSFRNSDIILPVAIWCPYGRDLNLHPLMYQP